MNPELDTLATALYTTIDDLLIENPHWKPERPKVGIAPQLSDAELVTLAVLQAVLRFDSEARFIRFAKTHLRAWFPYIPGRSGYNKRLRRSHQLLHNVMNHLARNSRSWHDDLWLVDSTPIECGRSRQTQQRSDLAGYAAYGYTASHHRFFWGIRLHLLAAPSGLPIAYALTPPAADERSVCLDMLDRNRLARPGQTIIADKGYRKAEFEQQLHQAGMTLIRPSFRSEEPRPHQQYLRAFRQIIESIIQTLKTQLGLERHGGRTRPGVAVRVLQRLLALTAVIWHNETTHQPGPARSLTAYDH